MGAACVKGGKEDGRLEPANTPEAQSGAEEDLSKENKELSKGSGNEAATTDSASTTSSTAAAGMQEETVPRERSSVDLTGKDAAAPKGDAAVIKGEAPVVKGDAVPTGGSRISLRWSLRKHDSRDAQSNSGAVDAKPRRMSRCTHHPLAHEHVRDVVTHVLGQKKDQDRAVCVPALLPGVLYCGVFDGHGRDGETRSELATIELPRLIKRELTKVVDEGRTIKETDLHDALDVSYAEFHAQLDRLYEETVYKRAVEEAAARQKEENGVFSEDNDDSNAPVRMPQDGGTTATSVIVSGETIVVGWVGDSRAVLARRIAKKRGPILNRFSSRLKISTLTEDHNVATNNEQEMQRVADQGGEIYGKHLAAGAVEGMLQLTRSLGDSPFHRTGLVVSKPGIVTIPVVDDNVDPLLFLLVASDGLWDHFTNKEALSFVYKRLKKEGYACEASEEQRSRILTETARALEQEAIKRSTDRKSHSDDITVLLLTFTKGWSIEAEDQPSF